MVRNNMWSASMMYIFLFGMLFGSATTNLSLIDGAFILLGGTIFYQIIKKQDFLWIIAAAEHRTLLSFALIIILSIIFHPFDSAFFGIATLYCISIFFVARFLSQMTYREIILSGYLYGAIIASAIVLGIFFFLKDTYFYETVTQDERLLFFFSDPNVFGAYLVPAFIISMADLCRDSSMIRTRIFQGLVSALIFLAILFTGSRGTYIQTAFAFGVFFILECMSIQKYKISSLLLMIGCISVPIIYFASTDAVHVILSGRVSTSDIPRVENIVFAQDLIVSRDAKSLLIGTGNGSYEFFSPDQFSAHNLFLRIFVENGALGLIIFLCFLSLLAYQFIGERKRNRTDHIIFASIIGILVHSMFIDTLHWRHFWLLLGLL